MNKTFIAVFGKKSSGKTYLCNYLTSRYAINTIYITKLLEEKLCTSKDGEKQYYNLKFLEKNRISAINFLSNEFINIIKKSNILTIEGLLNKEDLVFLKESYNANCVCIFIENKDFNLRLERYINRNCYPKNIAMEKLKESDLQWQTDYDEQKQFANFLISNNNSKQAFELQIDSIMKSILEN